jgi:hypothetical protein
MPHLLRGIVQKSPFIICQRFPQPAFDTGGYAQSKHILGIFNHILGILRDFQLFPPNLVNHSVWDFPPLSSALPGSFGCITSGSGTGRDPWRSVTFWNQPGKPGQHIGGCREVSEPSELSGFYLHIYIIYIYICVCVCMYVIIFFLVVSQLETWGGYHCKKPQLHLQEMVGKWPIESSMIYPFIQRWLSIVTFDHQRVISTMLNIMLMYG